LELADPTLDAVEPVAYVEPSESDVPGLEKRERVPRSEELRVDAPRTRGCDERVVRRAAPVGDDGELHGGIVRSERAAMGRDPVTRRCRSRYAFATGSSRY